MASTNKNEPIGAHAQTPTAMQRQGTKETYATPRPCTPKTPPNPLTPICATQQHTRENNYLNHTARAWPNSKPAHIVIAQLSRLWSESWSGDAQRPDIPNALPDAHHSISVLASKFVDQHQDENWDWGDRPGPPFSTSPNPYYDPNPSQEVKWPYDLPRQYFYEDILTKDVSTGEKREAIYFLSSDGALNPAAPGKIARVAYGGVGHIIVDGEPIAYIKYGGRIPSPPSAEPPSSAMGESGGLCEAIRIPPLDAKAFIYLDAFAPISAAPSILFETATERCHRPNRHIWAEIEYLIRLRLSKKVWAMPNKIQLRQQLIQAEQDLKVFKAATAEARLDLRRPRIDIAGLSIRWVKGHDKAALKACKITAANWKSDEIAGECANTDGIPTRRWIKLIPMDKTIAPKIARGAPLPHIAE